MVKYFIAHRGNTKGPNPAKENHPEYILEALEQGFDVEIDVWYIRDQWFLGHDKPEYLIFLDFLKKPNLWCHAKNFQALTELLKHKVHVFSHNIDPVILTSKAIPWAYPGQPINEYTICVMPERTPLTYSSPDLQGCLGICSDHIENYRNIYRSDL